MIIIHPVFFYHTPQLKGLPNDVTDRVKTRGDMWKAPWQKPPGEKLPNEKLD